MSDTEVLKTTSTDVLPTEVHGFTVKVGVGPYPPDVALSHRQAMYAELIPETEKAKAAMKFAGRERILGMAPLTRRAAKEIHEDPTGWLAEIVSRRALQEAAKLANLTV